MVQRATITHTAPAGLLYVPEFITRDEELSLLERLDALDYEDVVMHGVTARRTVVHYGFNYGYESGRIEPTEPIPDWLQVVQARAAESANLAAETLEQVLVARYPDGAGIGWHRDAPMFGEPVIGISLGARGLMKFRRGAVGSWEVFPLWLAPRSLYVIQGAARYAWQHSLMPMKGSRYSLTWRTVKHDYRGGRRPASRMASEASAMARESTA